MHGNWRIYIVSSRNAAIFLPFLFCVPRRKYTAIRAPYTERIGRTDTFEPRYRSRTFQFAPTSLAFLSCLFRVVCRASPYLETLEFVSVARAVSSSPFLFPEAGSRKTGANGVSRRNRLKRLANGISRAEAK